MAISLTRLRTDLYKIVDQVLDTGIPVEIERHGQKLRIVVAQPKNKLANLIPHPDIIKGDPESIIHMDWSDEWKKEQNI